MSLILLLSLSPGGIHLLYAPPLRLTQPLLPFHLLPYLLHPPVFPNLRLHILLEVMDVPVNISLNDLRQTMSLVLG